MVDDMIDKMVDAGAKEIVLQTDLDWQTACDTARACLAAGLRAWADSLPDSDQEMYQEVFRTVADRLEKPE